MLVAPRVGAWIGYNQDMAKSLPVDVPRDKISDFCRTHHVRKLSFFGSVLRTDFRPDSDIDVLVEFEPNHTPGYLGMVRLQRELSEMLGGRKVDLRTPRELSKYFRQDVINAAAVQYAA
jgi:predicted nucleotidyltransferase